MTKEIFKNLKDYVVVFLSHFINYFLSSLYTGNSKEILAGILDFAF